MLEPVKSFLVRFIKRIGPVQSSKTMSLKHLGPDSSDPPRADPNLLRVYSNACCPFAQRVWLVLKVKKIPYELVNINLMNKPEWYFKIHPEGKVPALIDGTKIIIESLVISEYLDEKYPNNPLYPSDPVEKSKEKKLVANMDNVTSTFIKCLYTGPEKSTEEWKNKFLSVLQVYEDELSRRKTAYFGGLKPGMIDYMLWPFAERAATIPMRLGEKLELKHEDIPLLKKWSKTMENDAAVVATKNPPEAFWSIIDAVLKQEQPAYDNYYNKL